MQTTNSSGGKKTILWIAGGCLAVIVCALAVVVFGFGGLAWLGSQTPTNTDVVIGVPLEAAVGDQIELTVSIANSGSTAMQLMSIDISLNYLNGIAIDHTDPAFTESSQFNALGGGETFQTFYFHQSIAPGNTLTILFNGVAVAAGDYSGSVDVCIDSDFNCATNIVRTVIK